MLNQLLDRLLSKIHEAGNSLPPEQQRIKRKYGPATKREMMTPSTYPGEEVVKFWLLNDGTLIFVESAHYEIAIDYDKMHDLGAIRVKSDVDGGLLMLSYTVIKPNSEQIAALQGLARLHNTKNVLIDHDEGGKTMTRISSPSELSAILRGKVKGKSLAAQFHERVNPNPYNPMLDEGEGVSNPITRAILDLIKEYDKSPFDLNDGYCDNFAMDLEEMGLGKSVDGTQLPKSVWSKKILAIWNEWESTDEDFFRPTTIHTFLLGNDGKYYDAENPDGVDRPEDLKIFRRYYNAITKGKYEL